MFLACWECQMLRDAYSKLLWRHLWYPPATEINFWFRFAKSSNFLLSSISSQEKINARYNRWPTYLKLWSLSTLLADFWRSPSVREFTMQRAAVLSKRAGFSTVSARLQRRGESYFSTYCSNFPLHCLWTLSVLGDHRMAWVGCDVFQDRLYAELQWAVSKEKYAHEMLWGIFFISLQESECEILPLDILPFDSDTQTDIYMLSFTSKQVPEPVGKPVTKTALCCNLMGNVLRPWQKHGQYFEGLDSYLLI